MYQQYCYGNKDLHTALWFLLQKCSCLTPLVMFNSDTIWAHAQQPSANVVAMLSLQLFYRTVLKHTDGKKQEKMLHNIMSGSNEYEIHAKIMFTHHPEISSATSEWACFTFLHHVSVCVCLNFVLS